MLRRLLGKAKAWLFEPAPERYRPKHYTVPLRPTKAPRKTQAQRQAERVERLRLKRQWRKVEIADRVWQTGSVRAVGTHEHHLRRSDRVRRAQLAAKVATEALMASPDQRAGVGRIKEQPAVLGRGVPA